MKKLISLILSCILLLGTTIPVFAEKEGNSKAENYFNTLSANEVDLECNLTGAYLCEASTGKVLYAQDEFKAASPASVTKIMTLLLVCEALESGRFNLTDTVRISAKAASMGGSQVFLEEGEKNHRRGADKGGYNIKRKRCLGCTCGINSRKRECLCESDEQKGRRAWTEEYKF